ncbi:MAG: hypothetical protein ABDI19_01885 [Armatimonadota bacterium]
MKSRTTKDFRQMFASLPQPVQQQAQKAYQRFQQNPKHPSLRFKRVSTYKPIYSVRINESYRALGVMENEDTIIWFWIGNHDDYERLIRSL